MGFSCYCDDPCAVWNVAYPKARVPHTCCECGYKIKPGEKYERIKSLYDGAWDNYDTCERCSDLAESGAELGMCRQAYGLFEDYAGYLDDLPVKLDADGDPISGFDRASAIQAKHRDWV